MAVVAIISTKGGAGKSTIAVQYTVALHAAGHTPLIIDCDESQNSIMLWAEALRRSDHPEIRAATDATFEAILAEGRAQGFDPIVIDVPPSGGTFVQRIASIADHIIVPVRPSAFDIHAMRNTIDLLRITVDNSEPEALACRSALGKAVIVLNAIPQRPSLDWRADLESALDKCGAGGLPIVGVLSDRAAYKHSIASGKGVLELSGKDPAKDEVTEFQDNMERILAKRRALIRKSGGGRR